MILHSVKLPADQGAQFPPICPGCGETATETFTVTARAGVLDFVLGPSTWLVWILLGRRKRLQISTCQGCRCWMRLRWWAMALGIVVSMLLVADWAFWGSHSSSHITLVEVEIVALSIFFVAPVVAAVVGALLPPFLTFSLRRGRLSYLFVSEAYAKAFALMNSGEVEAE
jgi:hypothetical protein